MMFRTEKVKQEIKAPCCITLTFNEPLDIQRDDVFEYHGKTYSVQEVDVKRNGSCTSGRIMHQSVITHVKLFQV